MIVAAIALVIALTGTAIAGPDAISNKITKSKVKNIANKQIDKAPGLSVKRADNAKSADKAKIASNIYSAMVRDDGLMLGSVPDGATSSRVSQGRYRRVNFGRDITGCTIFAALAGVAYQSRAIVQAYVADSTHVALAMS